MDSGDIILVDFPFTIPAISKVRPAVFIAETADKYKDIIVCAISSVITRKPSLNEILVMKNDTSFAQTGLRVDSVIKIDRIATLRKVDVIIRLGRCDVDLWERIRGKFSRLPESISR